MRVALITRAPFENLTGPSFYHRRLLAALRELGDESEVVALDAPAAATLADRFGDGTVIIIDGAALELAREAIPGLQARGAAALIHQPTTPGPGAQEARRHELRTFERAVLPGFVRVIATSEPVADRLSTEFGVIRDKIQLLLPGTDRQPRRSVDPAAPPGGPCTILSIGSMIRRKGHDVLLAALATLGDLDWHLILAGEDRDPEYAAQIDAQIARLGIGARVERRGALVAADLDAVWNRADVFALATRFEGFGMAIAEAMARGLPVAITNGGAAAQLVPASAGVIAPVDDVAQYAKALRRLVFSPSLRAEMGAAAWDRASTLPGWADQARLLRRLSA